MSILTHPGVKSVIPSGQNGAIPPLENGDRLTRAEFMRRDDAMPDVKKAELIEGVVYVPSPVRQMHHGEPHSDLVGWLFVYKAGTPGVATGDNSTLLLDLDNAPQPDGLLFRQTGTWRPGQDQRRWLYRERPRSRSRDRREQCQLRFARQAQCLSAQRRARICRPSVLDGQVDWFVLKEGRFEAWRPRLTVSCGAPSSRACGSTRPRWFAAMWRRSWRWSSGV